jgi:hypothetical protein
MGTKPSSLIILTSFLPWTWPGTPWYLGRSHQEKKKFRTAANNVGHCVIQIKIKMLQNIFKIIYSCFTFLQCSLWCLLQITNGYFTVIFTGSFGVLYLLQSLSSGHRVPPEFPNSTPYWTPRSTPILGWKQWTIRSAWFWDGSIGPNRFCSNVERVKWH